MNESLEERILQKLADIESKVSMQGITPRWLDIEQARMYAGGRSKNWILEKLQNGEISGYQEKGEKGKPGKWIVDRNSIDEFYSEPKQAIQSKYLAFSKRAGL